MPTVPVTTTDQTEDWGTFRFGQSFNDTTVRAMMDRDPYAHFLCFLLPLRALGNGFNLMKVPHKSRISKLTDSVKAIFKRPKKEEKTEEDTDKDNKPSKSKEGPLDNNDEIWDVLLKPWEKIVERAAPYERGYGLSDIVIYKNDRTGANENDKLFLKVFRSAQIDSSNLEYNKDETIKKISFKEAHPISGDDTPWEVKDLKDLYHNIQRQKENWWEGRSYLEPIWDELQSLRAIRMGATLFAVRVGAGLKIIQIPKNTPKSVVAQMKIAARELNSLNGFFLLPDEEAKVTISSGSGMVDYHALKRVCLEAVTAYTGIPMVTLVGIEMERQGADFNQESEDDYKREIWRQYEPIAKWLILRYNEYYEWGLTEDSFTLELRLREDISDKDQADTDLVRAQADSTDVNAGILSPDEVREARGIEGKAPERPSMFGVNVKGLDDQDPEKKEEEKKDNE